MITHHQYLIKYPVDPKATKLILGTIHPHYHEQFELQFFYGNELSLWNIFHQAFPDELPNPQSLEDVLKFLKNRKIAVSDTILQCERVNPTALDEDLRVIVHNDKILKDAITNSAISEILCTSAFGKNNAFKIFYCDILKQKLTANIRQTKEVILPETFFGRSIKVRAIYSPASTANRGIGKSPGYKAVENEMSTDQYRVALYKRYFGVNEEK
jgi:G:T/U-mismatch repair DNA glycosylase